MVQRKILQSPFDICGDRKHMVALPSCCGNLPALDESGMKKKGEIWMNSEQ